MRNWRDCLIVLGLVVYLVAFGLAVTTDSYRQKLVREERDYYKNRCKQMGYTEDENGNVTYLVSLPSGGTQTQLLTREDWEAHYVYGESWESLQDKWEREKSK